ncbi:pyridoxamine 5'-phosphate oxidase family protein [Bosea vaviloviae]|uniref:Pyridoxamine 5'-phosphate oxidase n=1 Tax=Bosea vaviloviae TaxID=1526658 RepID=A0A1D7U880_9HYPH|nr:pyridoxamine 5'-phosphate oxidase family protein [Bosea vaviloviae]AOO83577.1 pyridoxamine 5'-phosphate oxidase [Bosea vaviloviae]
MDGTPFHPGELEAQALAGTGSRGAGIRDLMPEQHRIFFGQLPLLFAALSDEAGHPIATVLSGEPGFVRSPTPTTLSIRALPPSDDPAALHLKPGQPIGLLGLEFPTRRRNRANGLITARDTGGFSVAVAQSFGNCAKYIQARTPQPVAPVGSGSFEPIARLDDAARGLIGRSDTFFVASTSEARKLGGLDISHRGGRPGFVGIDGEVLSVPDFAGNNYFNTLGNLLRDPRASLLFIDFENGAVLQLQGRVEIVWSGPEVARLSGAERIWRLHVASGWRRRAALPLQWSSPEPAATTLATGVWA